MTFTARFGTAQGALGIQFFKADGTLLASRITAGIVALPETGSYSITTTPPALTVGIYWNDTVTLATAVEDLRDALALDALSVAAGDPWLATVPGDYEDGTAGAALGRLNNTPPEAPVVVIPDPSDDDTLCVVYVSTEALTNTVRAGIVVTFTLSRYPSRSEKVLESAVATMTTASDGTASISLQRTDTMTPAGRYYLVDCEALGFSSKRMTLAADTFDLATLIS